MLRLWLVLATLAALALSVQVPAVDNDDWHVDGQRTVLPVEGCTQFRSALLLHQGSAAMYRFNGTPLACARFLSSWPADQHRRLMSPVYLHISATC